MPWPCHGQAGHRSSAGDAEMLWQSPWQPQYTARRTKLPAEKRQREEKRKVGKEKAGKAKIHGAKMGQEGGMGREISCGGGWRAEEELLPLG